MFQKCSLHRISNMCHKMEASGGEWQHIGMSYAPTPPPYPCKIFMPPPPRPPPPTSLGRMRPYLQNAAMKMDRKTCVIRHWCTSEPSECARCGVLVCCRVISPTEPAVRGPSLLSVIELSMIINESLRRLFAALSITPPNTRAST